MHVTGEVMNTRVPVRFCDFGEVEVVSISCLRQLEPQFYQVPFMAVKGKLAGTVVIMCLLFIFY